MARAALEGVLDWIAKLGRASRPYQRSPPAVRRRGDSCSARPSNSSPVRLTRGLQAGKTYVLRLARSSDPTRRAPTELGGRIASHPLIGSKSSVGMRSTMAASRLNPE